MVVCKRLFTMERLVKLLCADTKEAGCFFKALSNFRATHRAGRDMIVRNDLIRAAEYAQNEEKVRKSHPFLTFPVMGTVVASSKQEFCMSKGYGKRERIRNCRLSQLFIFLSLIGGQGVYSLENLSVNAFVTEYGGVVLDAKEAQELRKQGFATHMRTL
jgi:hypothetical protein